MKFHEEGGMKNQEEDDFRDMRHLLAEIFACAHCLFVR